MSRQLRPWTSWSSPALFWILHGRMLRKERSWPAGTLYSRQSRSPRGSGGCPTHSASLTPLCGSWKSAASVDTELSPTRLRASTGSSSGTSGICARRRWVRIVGTSQTVGIQASPMPDGCPSQMERNRRMGDRFSRYPQQTSLMGEQWIRTRLGHRRGHRPARQLPDHPCCPKCGTDGSSRGSAAHERSWGCRYGKCAGCPAEVVAAVISFQMELSYEPLRRRTPVQTWPETGRSLAEPAS